MVARNEVGGLAKVVNLPNLALELIGLIMMLFSSLQSKPLMVKTARLALWLFMDPASGAAVRKKVLEIFTLFFENVSEVSTGV